MLPRDRVHAALNHQEPDRIPWGEHLTDLQRFSGSCWLLPYKKNRAAYVPPTIESIQADIEEPEAEPPEDVSSSMQEVHRYAVEHTRSTHFMAALGAVTG